jgi:iron complex transport system substrate-binding protein
MSKRFGFLSLLLALTALLTACGAVPVTQAPTLAPTAVPTLAPTAVPTLAPTAVPTRTPAQAQTITDDLGRTITLAATPERIVSLAPSVTEMLFAIGAGSQVVGNTKFCNYPPEATALTEIGGFSAKSISIEAIVELQPDLVIAGTASQLAVIEQLAPFNIPAVVLAPASFNDVYTSIIRIGTLTGRTEAAEQLVNSMRTRVDTVLAKVATIPDSARPTVFWEVFDDPLTTSSQTTFIGQMIELVGAKNIFADTDEDYPQVSVEAIIERNPQVILGSARAGQATTTDTIRQRPGWMGIQAIREQRVYLFDSDIVSRPGPRLVDAIEAVATALYPDTFR